jgi:DNA polymerase-3 subunit gamma/tau
MSHISLYRKYRPQTFDQVLGQDTIVKSLQSALQDQKISHAYLFAGSRGTGKTSIARIFARELGVSTNDIYEIDAASNRGINEMKELLAGVGTLPFDSKYKVYILDEVHMFTKEAWNALLKTLEEPPKHVIFILATTEIHKVLDTIISRCQVYEFKKPTLDILKKMLAAGAHQEGVSLSDDALIHIAKMGNGAFRDTWGIFERVIQSSEKKKNIELDDVMKILAKPHQSLIEESIAALAQGSLEDLLQLIQQIGDSGLAYDDYLERMIELVRLVLLYRFVPVFAGVASQEVSDTTRSQIQEWAAKRNIFNADLLAQLIDTLDQVKRSPMPEIILELAFIKILGNNA